MRNQIVERYPTHAGLTDERIGEIVREIFAETGFVRAQEVQRRMIYDPDKVWRVRIRGTFDGKPALLRVENLKLDVDEESIRAAFRRQTEDSRVRPPRTYATKPFDDDRGYAWSIDEFVDAPVLFLPGMRPFRPARDFVRFYRELREAVTEPFWPADVTDAEAFSRTQAATWSDLARSHDAERIDRLAPTLDRLKERILSGMRGRVLSFMHPHLSGADVRVTRDGEYVVFANHFWSWRQPGYDVAFPIWGQWLALRADHRNPESVCEITDAWLAVVVRELRPYVDPEAVRTMLLNRLYGSLLLDVPAQRHRETAASVAAMEQALVAEAERLLA